VALEATTNTWGVVAILKPFVKEVVVSNPLRTKAIASAKVKTDKVDSLVLAQLLRCDYLPRVWEPPASVQAARSITGRRAALIADRTAVKNRIQAALRQRLIMSPGRSLFSARGRAWLARIDIDEPGKLAIESDLRIIDALDQEIDAVDARLLKNSAGSDDAKLLVTLPGVDVSVAQTVLAALGDIRRFPDPDRAASYLGLTPSTRQSADHCAHGPITKHGNSTARWLLVQAAKKVAAHPGPLGAFFGRVAKKRGHNIAAVATARKMVVIAWYMLTRHQPYRYAQPKTTEGKLRRIRTAGGDDRRKGPRRPTIPRPKGTQDARRVPSLPQVYSSEGLPDIAPLSRGEKRMLKRNRLAANVAKLQKEQWVRKASPSTATDKRRKNAEET
jgi:transposase